MKNEISCLLIGAMLGCAPSTAHLSASGGGAGGSGGSTSRTDAPPNDPNTASTDAVSEGAPSEPSGPGVSREEASAPGPKGSRGGTEGVGGTGGVGLGGGGTAKPTADVERDDARSEGAYVPAKERPASADREGTKAKRPPPAAPSADLGGEGARPDVPEEKRVVERERRPPPKAEGVKAGAADDNLQFGAFLAFLAEHEGRVAGPNISKRTVVAVKDAAGLPIADAQLSVLGSGGAPLARRHTYPDGRALFFPSESAAWGQDAKLRVEYRGKTREVSLAESRRQVDVVLDLARIEHEKVPLDVAFVLDTTCSMGDEIDRLKETLQTIHFQISNFRPRPDVRFGMVLFRDLGDDYRTKVVPFTGDVEAFARQLEETQAGGGGDTPEDVEEALRVALHKLSWRDSGAKVAFLIGDAAPHFDYGQKFGYAESARLAAERGIKIAAIGASGLDTVGEIVWRRLAQYTMAPFVFLTYGETGDSEGGTPSSVSHHVGSNWVAENLDAIIIRMLKLELLHYAPKAAPRREDYFEAKDQPGLAAQDVLEELFGQSAKQLVAYAVERIDDRTPTVVLPLGTTGVKLKAAREKLETRLQLGLSSQRAFQLVESKNVPELQKLLAKQFEASYDEKKMIEVGRLVPARLAVLANLTPGGAGRLEMLVKLIRLETGEVLSLSLLKLDESLVL